MSSIGYLRVAINDALRIILQNITLTVSPVYLRHVGNDMVEYEIDLTRSVDNQFEFILKDRLRICGVEVEDMECYKICKITLHKSVPVVVPMVDDEGELTYGDSLLSTLVDKNLETQIEADFDVVVVVVTERRNVQKNAMGYIVTKVNISGGKFKLRNHSQLFNQLRERSGISTRDISSFAMLY